VTDVLDVVPLLIPEREILLDVLAGLDPAEWNQPTECPAWTVKGIALHILGDDFSLLSRQRDASVNSIMLWAERMPGQEIFAILDRFNEDWVDNARFFSARVLIDLLRATGEWTHSWYTDVDPDVLGEPVWFVSSEPAPYWMIAAREHLERWVHQQQIRRAVGQPELVAEPHFSAAIGAAVRGFPQGFSSIEARDGTEIALEVGGRDKSWSVRRADGAWGMAPTNGTPDVVISMDGPTAAAVFSKGLSIDETRARVDVSGDQKVGQTVKEGIVAFFGRNEEAR